MTSFTPAVSPAAVRLDAHWADSLLYAQQQVLESIVRGRPLQEVLGELCRIVESQSKRPLRAAILLVDDTAKRLHTGAAPSLPATYVGALDGILIDADVGTCCAAAARAEVVVTPDIDGCERWQALKHLPLSIGLRAAWSMPIISASGAVLGTFGTYFLEPSEPTARERQLVEVLSRTAALAIERQRADETLRVGLARNRFLADLSNATQPLTHPAALMATAARMLAQHLDVNRCAYAEVENESVFVITGDYSPSLPSIVGRWDVAAFGHACLEHMLANTPYVVTDSESDDRIGAEDLAAYRATNIRAVVCVPLHKDGRFTAAMAVHQDKPRHWSRDDIELVTLVVARCWEALERSRVARDLSESEARYRAIVEATPECVKLVGPDGELLQMNAAGLRMIEAPAENAVIGQCVYPVIAPEYRDAFRAFNERVCRGERGTLEFDIIGMQGTRRSMETTAVPLPFPSGGFGQLAITRDVTARVQADRALSENRARLDYAVRLSGVGFWYCDLPFDELIWDARVKEHFFLPADARVTIETFYERMYPADREATRLAIENSIERKASYDVVYRTFDPDTGAIKFIRALGGTYYSQDGRPVRFDGVTVDVTAQRTDQELLKEALAREQQQGHLLRQVAETALKIHRCDSLEEVLRVVAEEARALIGAHQAVTSFSVGQHFDQSINTVSRSDKYHASRSDDTSGGHGIHVEVSRTNRPMRLTRAQLETHPARRSISGEGAGQPPLIGWLAVPLIGRNGANLGVVQLSDKYEGEFTEADEAILTQLAQVAAVAIENTRLYDELREQDRRKDEFLATLAHELRNPLAPVRTGLEVLQRSNDPEQASRARQMMARQLNHLVRMVDDLLDISRITLGKLALKKERIDFRSVLHSAMETARPFIEASGHELAVRLPKQSLPLEVDATRIAQVIANLLHNAAKYTPAGGRIQLAAESCNDALIVRISDNGVGIPADMLHRIFDMFTQVGRSMDRAQGGLGVGLTLVRRLVELHDGSIVAHSDGLGEGSTFTLRLPLAVSTSGDAVSHGGAIDSKDVPLKVLVVDDNVDAAESLGMLLQLQNHVIRIVYDGNEAIAAVREFQPDIVFLDLGLPGLDGYGVAERVRTFADLRQPKLVALTGWGSDEDRRRSQAAGFDHHLVKPVDFQRLEAALAIAGHR